MGNYETTINRILIGIFFLTTVLFAQVDTAYWKSMSLFSDEQSRLPEMNDAYGVAFKDLNNDRFPDLYITRFRNLNRFFLNRNGKFEDHTISSGLGGNLFPRRKNNLELGASAVHVTGYPWPEIMIVGWRTTSLFKKSYGAMYEPIQLPGADSIDGNGVSWADFDRNGYVDAFIADEHHHNHLYLNQGYERFIKADKSWGLKSVAISQSGAVADLNHDGWPDLYVCNWQAPDRFYINDKGRRFVEYNLHIFHTENSVNSNHANFADLDNDGDLDLIVADRSAQSRIYINKTDFSGPDVWIRFEQANEFPFYQYPAYSATVADFNNDGYPDIYWAGIGPNAVSIGDSSGFLPTFEAHKVAGNDAYSTGAAVADFDQDGDVDLFVSNKDTSSILWENPINNRHFIRVRVVGGVDNRDAIGSKVFLYRMESSGQLILVGSRLLGNTNGYLSESENCVHFGTPITGSYLIRVVFPSGKIQEKKPISPGEVITVSEQDGWMMQLSFWRFRFISAYHSPYFTRIILMTLILLILVTIYFYPLQNRYELSTAENSWTIFLLLAAILIPTYFNPDKNPLTLVSSQFIVSVVILLMALVRNEIRLRARILKKERRRALIRFSEQAIHEHDNLNLLKQFTEIIGRSIENSSVALYDGRPPHSRIHLVGNDTCLPENVAHLLPEMLLPSQVIREIALGELKERGNPALLIFLRKKVLHGVLLIVFEKGESVLKREMTDMVQLVINQIVIALENNVYIEKQKELERKLVEQEVRQRYIGELEDRNRQLTELNHKLKNTKMQLIQSEKLASLGQLVAGIAHELNNPISFIYANSVEMRNYLKTLSKLINQLERLKESLQLESEFENELKEMKDNLTEIISDNIEGSQRVKEIVQNLKDFARIDSKEKVRVDINRGIQSTLRLLRKQIPANITIQTDLGENCLAIGHPGQLNQVFMNLMVNALQAMKEKGGKLKINTGKESEWVKISISDTGHGIPHEVLDHIFDPFYTTRPVGEGTGLGLSVSYTIIQNHEGNIRVHSKPGEGSNFIVSLPYYSDKKGNQNGHTK